MSRIKINKWIGWLFIVCIWVLLILFAEFISGHFYNLLTPKSGRISLDIMSDKLKPEQFGVICPHPYLLYTHQPNWKSFGITQFNSMGYRGSEISLKAKNGTIRILAIGESTTAGYPYVERPDQAWPAQLEKLLKSKTGKKIEVINAGLSSSTSAESLVHYLFRNRYLNADIVIIHTGGNDAEALMFENYNPEYTHYIQGWIANPLAPRYGERRLLKINIFKVFYAWWLKNASIQQSIGKKIPYLDVKPKDALVNVQKKEPVGFERNLDLLTRNIREDGSIPVLFPFVYAPKQVFKRNDINNYLKAHYDAFVIGWEKNIKVMKRIADANQILLVEIPKKAIPIQYFLDHCHLNADGEFLKAEYISDYLIPIIDKIQR